MSEIEGHPTLFWGGDLWEQSGTGQAVGMGTGGSRDAVGQHPHCRDAVGALWGMPAPTSPALGPTGHGPWCS